MRQFLATIIIYYILIAPSTATEQEENTLMNNTNNYEELISNFKDNTLSLNLKNIHLSRDNLSDLENKIIKNSSIGHIIWGTIPEGGEQNVKNIEDKILLNNKSYRT